MRDVRVAVLVLFLLLATAFCPLASGQGTTQYIYDANGRLTGIIAPNGEAAIYRYDPAGNLTAIEHIGAGEFAALSFTPQIGTIGDQVTFTGVGLNTVSSVSFNGTPAQIASASPNALTALVPDGATTGLITLSGVRGTFTTASAFTVVARIVISPALAEVVPGESVGFTATVVGTPDQRVTWAVNGINGGNAALGTIDASGLYQSPSIDTGLTVTINATSQVDTQVTSSAAVRLLNPNFTSEVRSSALTVGVGLTRGAIFSSAPVGVQKGAPVGIESKTVSVLEGSLFSIQSSALSVELGSFIPIRSSGLTVELGEAFTASSRPVSAELGVLFPISAGAVSETTGPVVTNISPKALTRGTTLTVTISGQNLGSASKVSFNKSSGTLEQNISVSNLSVSSDGTTLTFTAVVATSAATGNDVVYVLTPNGTSQVQNIGTNIVTIQ